MTSCPGCGALFPPQDGPTHRYIGASAACWALFSAATIGSPVDASDLISESRVPDSVVQVPAVSVPASFDALFGDAYGVQHHGDDFTAGHPVRRGPSLEHPWRRQRSHDTSWVGAPACTARTRSLPCTQSAGPWERPDDQASLSRGRCLRSNHPHAVRAFGVQRVDGASSLHRGAVVRAVRGSRFEPNGVVSTLPRPRGTRLYEDIGA